MSSFRLGEMWTEIENATEVEIEIEMETEKAIKIRMDGPFTVKV